MTRKLLTAVMITAYMLSATACSGNKAQTGTAAPATTAAAATAAAETKAAAETTIKAVELKETTAEEKAAEEEIVTVADSGRPYTLSYNANAFTRETPASVEDPDVYNYTAEEGEAPVYVSIQLYSDFSAEALTQGLVLQNDLEDSDVRMAYFGADGIETQGMTVQTEAEGITRIQMFHVIPNGDGSILIEVGGYLGMSEDADMEIEELLGSFKLV